MSTISHGRLNPRMQRLDGGQQRTNDDGSKLDCPIYISPALSHRSPWISTDVALDDIAGCQVASDAIPNLNEHWSKRVQQVSKTWKTHRLIIGAVFAPTFPLLSVSPLPKCSWAYLFAIICLLFGSMTFTICAIYGVYFDNIDMSKLHVPWCMMPNSGFFRKHVLHFYVSLSLPTVWFSGFVASFAMTILMILLGVQDSHDHLETGASVPSTTCQNKAKILLAVVPLIIVIAAIGFVRSIRYVSKNLNPSISDSV